MIPSLTGDSADADRQDHSGLDKDESIFHADSGPGSVLKSTVLECSDSVRSGTRLALKIRPRQFCEPVSEVALNCELPFDNTVAGCDASLNPFAAARLRPPCCLPQEHCRTAGGGKAPVWIRGSSCWSAINQTPHRW